MLIFTQLKIPLKRQQKSLLILALTSYKIVYARWKLDNLLANNLLNTREISLVFFVAFKKIERNGDKLKEEKTICGLYPRVSTEDQSRFGHSLDE